MAVAARSEKRRVIVMSTAESKASIAGMQHHGEEANVGAESQRPAKKAKVAEWQRLDEKAKLKLHTNLRPYVRSSTHKLRWTRELHQSFMNAVNKLGGQDRATPKQILSHMGRDDVTIAHVKSHLQMLRLSKINAEGLPVAAEADPVVLNPIAVKPSRVDPPDSCAPLSAREQREVFTALQLLKRGNLVAGPEGAEKLFRGLMDFDTFVSKAPDSGVTHQFTHVGDNNVEKRKVEDDVGLDLSIGIGVKSPNSRLRFPSPDTPEETSLRLELALAIRAEKSP